VRSKISPETFIASSAKIVLEKQNFPGISQFQMTKKFVEKQNSLISTSLESLIF
jgi:hypothetical protein